MCSEPTSPPTNGATDNPQTGDDADRDRSICPAPLDCSDLADILRTDTTEAFHMLMTLTLTQLNLQALAYATYLNQRHGLDLDMDDILTGWQRRIELARRTV
jgi:hypothetical protein